MDYAGQIFMILGIAIGMGVTSLLVIAHIVRSFWRGTKGNPVTRTDTMRILIKLQWVFYLGMFLLLIGSMLRGIGDG